MMNKRLPFIALLTGCLFLFCGCRTENEEQTEMLEADSSVYVTKMTKKRIVIDKTALVDVENQRKAVNKIARDNEGELVKGTTTYQTDLTKSSQNDIDFTINKLKLTEIDTQKTSENMPSRAILSLCYTLKNKANKEINIHPKEAVLLLNNGDKIAGDDFIDYWEDVFTKGKRKNGSFHFKFTDTNQVKAVKALKIIFKGDVIEDQETIFEKEYLFDFPLDLD